MGVCWIRGRGDEGGLGREVLDEGVTSKCGNYSVDKFIKNEEI